MTRPKRQPAVNLTLDELIEDLAFLAENGVGMREAAKRTGFTVIALERRLDRHGHKALLGRLRVQDPPAVNVHAIRADVYAQWKRGKGAHVIADATRHLQSVKEAHPDPEWVKAKRRGNLDADLARKDAS